MHPGHVNLLPPEHRRRRRRKKRPHCLFFVLIFLIIGVGGCLGGAIFGTELPETPEAYDPVTLEPKKPEGVLGKIKHLVLRREPTLSGEKDDRINFLVMGQGGPGHDGPYLTDTIIFASVKPSTGQVAFSSIPRDLAVEVPGAGVRKINYANAYGEMKKRDSGPKVAKDVFEETFDVEINYTVRIDFHAFEELIDEVGGVRVDVNRSFVDSEYPGPNHTYQTISFAKGPQTMDGETALTYVRSRHGNNGEGSDYARSRRQQKVILALKEKMLSFQTLSNPIKIHGIIQSLSDNILTDMSFSDIISFLKLAKELDTSNIITLTLDDGPSGHLQSGTTSYGAFILKPKSGNYEEIQLALQNIFEEPPAVQEVTTPSQEEPVLDYTGVAVEVQNGTWRAGLAARTRGRLTEKSFVVSSVGNTNIRPIEKSGVYVAKNSQMVKDVADGIKRSLNIPIKEALPNGEAAAAGTDILVILGDDFEE